MMQHATLIGPNRRSADQLGADDKPVQDFLERMAVAITSGDLKAISQLWGYPSMAIGDGMVQCITSAEDVEKFFASAKAQYNERGIVNTRGEIQAIENIGERLVTVDVRWPYLDASAAEIGAEASTYTLRRDDSGVLKLHVAVMRGVES